MRSLGVDALVRTAQAEPNGFDLIIDTIPVTHNLDSFLPLLDVDGRSASLASSARWRGLTVPPGCRRASHYRVSDRRVKGDAGVARLLRGQEYPSGCRNCPNGPDRQRV